MIAFGCRVFSESIHASRSSFSVTCEIKPFLFPFPLFVTRNFFLKGFEEDVLALTKPPFCRAASDYFSEEIGQRINVIFEIQKMGPKEADLFVRRELPYTYVPFHVRLRIFCFSLHRSLLLLTHLFFGSPSRNKIQWSWSYLSKAYYQIGLQR